jgi:hypothetical protein
MFKCLKTEHVLQNILLIPIVLKYSSKHPVLSAVGKVTLPYAAGVPGMIIYVTLIYRLTRKRRLILKITECFFYYLTNTNRTDAVVSFYCTL